MAFSGINLAVALMICEAGEGFRSIYGLISEKVLSSVVCNILGTYLLGETKSLKITKERMKKWDSWKFTKFMKGRSDRVPWGNIFQM